MSKYQKLKEYLRAQTGHRVDLTFEEIERIIGYDLPPSAYAPRWWTNSRSLRPGPLWQEAWRSAGYEALLILGADRVEFRRQS